MPYALERATSQARLARQRGGRFLHVRRPLLSRFFHASLSLTIQVQLEDHRGVEEADAGAAIGST